MGMESPNRTTLDLADALAFVDELLGSINLVCVAVRDELSLEDRETFTRAATLKIASACARTRWTVLGRLSPIDLDVFGSLVNLEPEEGGWFRTTGNQIWRGTSSCSHSIIYRAIARLHDAGLIERVTHRTGKRGTSIRIRWDQIREHGEALRAVA
jgi:hypothetical protein